MSVAPNHRLRPTRSPSPVNLPRSVTNGQPQSLSEALDDVLSRFDRVVDRLLAGHSQNLLSGLREHVLYAFHRGMDFEAQRLRVPGLERDGVMERIPTPLASPGRLFR
jgi:hypothetical protein